jgi:CRISPR-associated protein Cmr1
MTRSAPPAVPPLPKPVRRSRRGEPARESFEVELESVTPILGGAAATRTVDEVDVIRVPTIRGHLRFWWRALQSSALASPRELFKAETELWGRAADDSGGRSAVEITVELTHRSGTVGGDPSANSPDGYALWPARGTDDEPPAPRRQPGVRFRLIVRAPRPHVDAIRNSIRAWLLFGGYGSRTRRGVGSLSAIGDEEDQSEWLPLFDPGPAGRTRLRHRLREAFGMDVFGPLAEGVAPSFPILGGANLMVGAFTDSAIEAWGQSVHWLREFRQGVGTAREKGTAPRRPGRSRWPEPDKLRRLFATHSTPHVPRYEGSPNWPRAQFGLPILGQFSSASGSGDPPKFEFTWQDSATGELQDRLASPLILKAMPVVGGFYPCALWLTRSYPGGVVVVARQGSREAGAVKGSSGRFIAALSDADKELAKELGAPWDGSSDMRRSFLTALMEGRLDPQRRRAVRVA